MSEKDVKDLIDTLTKTEEKLKNVVYSVLDKAYELKLPWECMWCGYKIPVNGTKQEWKRKIKLHLQICIPKQFPSLGGLELDFS